MGKDGKRKRETDSEDAKKEQATAGGSHYYAFMADDDSVDGKELISLISRPN